MEAVLVNIPTTVTHARFVVKDSQSLVLDQRSVKIAGSTYARNAVSKLPLCHAVVARSSDLLKTLNDHRDYFFAGYVRRQGKCGKKVAHGFLKDYQNTYYQKKKSYVIYYVFHRISASLSKIVNFLWNSCRNAVDLVAHPELLPGPSLTIFDLWNLPNKILRPTKTRVVVWQLVDLSGPVETLARVLRRLTRKGPDVPELRFLGLAIVVRIQAMPGIFVQLNLSTENRPGSFHLLRRFNLFVNLPVSLVPWPLEILTDFRQPLFKRMIIVFNHHPINWTAIRYTTSGT